MFKLSAIRGSTIHKKSVDGIYAYPIGVIHINSHILWKEGYRGDGIKVAVFDTGISNHSNLKNRVVYRKSFTGHIADDHGTHIAGIIGAHPDSEYGIYGVAPHVSFYDLQILGKNGGPDTAFASAVDEAIRLDVDIINASVGSPQNSKILEQAVKKAYRAGIIIVAAAGNSGKGSILYPGAMKECISVGNFNVSTGCYQKHSSSNRYVDVSAPGTSIYSCIFDNNYGTYTGTSQASAHVAGMCALLLQKVRKENGNIDKKECRRQVLALLKTCLMIRDVLDFDPYYGDGQLRYEKDIPPKIDSIAKNSYYYLGQKL